MLTQLRLRELVNYDPETGKFYWRKRPYQTGDRPSWEGKEAGTTSVQGYRLITLENEKFRAARVAWLYMTGEWPTHDIDHVNGDVADDRWCNLRSATKSENMQNMKRRKDNTSGVRGVSWNVRRQQWHARVTANGTNYHCGYFDTLEKAKATRDNRAAVLHGAFARFDQLYPMETTQ